MMNLRAKIKCILKIIPFKCIIDCVICRRKDHPAWHQRVLQIRPAFGHPRALRRRQELANEHTHRIQVHFYTKHLTHSHFNWYMFLLFCLPTEGRPAWLEAFALMEEKETRERSTKFHATSNKRNWCNRIWQSMRQWAWPLVLNWGKEFQTKKSVTR